VCGGYAPHHIQLFFSLLGSLSCSTLAKPAGGYETTRNISFPAHRLKCVGKPPVRADGVERKSRAHWQFEDRLRSVTSPGNRSYVALPCTTQPVVSLCFWDSSYPEGNFEGNQLPGGSMSLSPLCLTLTSDLHVSNATCFHHSFPWLHSSKV